MIRRQTGFTLIELLMVAGIMALVMAASANMFIGMLNEYKQQGKIAETNIEGVIGLELLRQDLERAGYGLPWVVPTTVLYNEAAVTTYNDCSGSGTCNPPRAIVTGNNADFIDASFSPNNQSDYLVIKAVNIIRNAASQKWTYLTTSMTKSWDNSIVPSENPTSNDNVIVLSPGATTADARTLVVVGGSWYTQFSSISNYWPSVADPQPRFVYDIYDNTVGGLRMPFNRADYYVTKTSTNVPARCAPNTGVLVKGMISQSDGSVSDILPLLDCVANMQVVFRLDTNGDGVIDTSTDDISGLTTQAIRQQVKEIRVYILAHEGQMDKNFLYTNSSPPLAPPERRFM